MAPWRIGVRGKATAPPRGRGGTVYSLLGPPNWPRSRTLIILLSDGPAMSHDPDFSESFYRRHAQRYAEVSHNFIQSVYSDVSHPGLQGDTDLMGRLQELVPPGRRGLDAGCGAGGTGRLLLLAEGVRTSMGWMPWMRTSWRRAGFTRNRLKGVGRRPSRAPQLPGTPVFDFVLCNAVIQHIEPAIALGTTLPEYARVLRAGGVLQLMFKYGNGVATGLRQGLRRRKDFPAIRCR